MANNMSNEEEAELLKTWWRDYGRYLALAGIVGVGLHFGWGLYKKKQNARKTAASELFQQSFQGTAAQISQAQKKLINQFSKSPYAALSQLSVAKVAVEDKQYPKADKALQWVVDHTKMDELKDVARLRMARIDLSQHHPEHALSALKPIKSLGFKAMCQTLKGDSYLQMGQIKSAEQAYKLAQTASQLSPIPNPLLELKQNSLKLLHAHHVTTEKAPSLK